MGLLTRVHATLSERVPAEAAGAVEIRSAAAEGQTVATSPRRLDRRPATTRRSDETKSAVPSVEGGR